MLTAYREIFRRPGFRPFWFGFTGSVIGDALTRVALTWFVYEMTGSPGALGWLMLCFTGPIVVGGLLAGWLLDRFDRRMVMIADNLVRGVAVGMIPLLSFLNLLQLWHIYVAAGIYGLLMMIALAGGPALIPSLVRPGQLATANALEMLSFTLGGVIGPMAAGMLIGRIGAPYVIILDVCSYFLYAGCLMLVPARIVRPAEPAAERCYGFGHAVGLLTGHPILLSTTMMFLVFNIGGGMLAVWLPILADRIPGGGPELYGLLLGILATGEVVSTLVAGSMRGSLSLGLRICLAQALAGAALFLALAGADARPVGIALALFGAFSAPLTIWAQTLRMQIIPEAMRGRAFALLRMLMQSGNPIGGALAGMLLPLVGVATMIAVSAGLITAAGALGTLVRDLRRDAIHPDGEGRPVARAAAAE